VYKGDTSDVHDCGRPSHIRYCLHVDSVVNQQLLINSFTNMLLTVQMETQLTRH
jgi:hypothetical protein